MMKIIYEKILTLLLLIGFFILNQLPLTIAAAFATYGSLSEELGYGLLFFVLLVLFLFLLYANYQGLFHWRDFLKRRPLRILFLSYIVIMTMNIIGSYILSLEGETTSTNQQLIIELLKRLPLVFMFLSIVISAPIEEEIMFRYLIPKKLFKGHQRIGFFIGILAFALVHSPTNIGSFMIYFCMGGVLSYLYYKYQRMEFNVSLHIINNFIAFISIISILK